MIASKDEFLLLLANWKNSYAKVTMLLVHGGPATINPLSSAFILELSGTITGISGDDSFFVLGSGDTWLVSIGFEGADFHFETAQDLESSFADLIPGSGETEVDEMISLLLPSGLKLFLLTPK
jgi:hypothetical protein